MATDLVTQIKGEIEQMVAENADLQERVDELELENASLLSENGDLEWREQHFNAKADALERENAELQAKVDELTCNDALAPEKIVTPVGVVANDANADSCDKHAEIMDELNRYKLQCEIHERRIADQAREIVELKVRINEDDEAHDRWLRDFQLSHRDFDEVTSGVLSSLACAMHDDIPFGYEASMRLGSWILNAASKMERQQEEADDWKKAFEDSAGDCIGLDHENAELQARVDELKAELSDTEYDCATCAAKNDLQSDYDAIIAKCAELCALCGFTMVDASGEAV